MAVAVVQVREQVVQAEVGLVDADRLVEPDSPWNGQAQRQPAGDDRREDDEGYVAAGIGLTPAGEPAPWPEQLGLASAAKAPKERPQ